MIYTCHRVPKGPHVYDGKAYQQGHNYELEIATVAELNVAGGLFRVATLDDAYNVTHTMDRTVHTGLAAHEVNTRRQDMARERSQSFKDKAELQALASVVELASNRQVGGDHYKGVPIQPAEYAEKNKLTFLEGNVVKRVTRHSRGGKGEEDIRKAIHELELILEFQYGATR